MSVPDHIARIERPCEALLKYYTLRAIATTIAFPVTMTLLYFRYHTMRFRFDDQGIHLRWGILLRHEIMLNYSRIQDIHLNSNVLERWMGLARIEIQTASGGGSDMTLEGIRDYEAMRDFLYSRMRGATTAEPETLGGVLHEIAGELKAIRQAIETRRA